MNLEHYKAMDTPAPIIPKPPMWTLEEALLAIREFYPLLDCVLFDGKSELCFHLALAGSVLERELSYDDLDIHIYPNSCNARKVSPQEILVLLPVTNITACGKEDYAHAEDPRQIFKCLYHGKRIDFFFLNP